MRFCGSVLKLLLLFVVWGSALPAAGQSIRLTAPVKTVYTAEGDDFAANELGNPWDFSERRDIGFEVDFNGASVGTAGGVWRGINERTGGYVFPLFGGFLGLFGAEGLPGDRSLPRFGINHPIDASRYRVLSVKFNHSARTSFAVHWNSNPVHTLFPTGLELGASYDGMYVTGGVENSGHTIYTFDMTAQPFEQQRGKWAGQIYALRLDPSIAGGPGALTEIDWMRLVDPDSAPPIDIRWTTAGLPPQSVVTVWLDSSGSGYDGTPFARYLHGGSNPRRPGHYSSHPVLQRDDGLHRFSSAVLPPGRHYFYLTVSVQIGSALVEIAKSGYSAPLVVNAAPEAYFTAPTEASGGDYSLERAKNPWDMSDAGDLVNLESSGLPHVLRQFSNPAFVDGVFQAMADAPLSALGNIHTDAQLHLSVPASAPIDTRRYRYLTYRLGADQTLFPSISDKVGRGWVSRAVYWNADIMADGGSTKAHILYEGMNTYTMDLWHPRVLDAGHTWQSFGSLWHLRLDPLETSIPTWFFLDWVSLTAENYPEQDHFRLSWVIDDDSPDCCTVSLYYDTDDRGFDGTRIAVLPKKKPGIHSYLWDTSALPDGRYYPYLVVDDGSASRAVYSSAPVVKGTQQAARTRAVPFDFDGDGLSDRTVYRGGSGIYYVNSAKGSAIAQQWGGFGYQPLDGDFDGDQRSDHAVVLDWYGALYWFVLRSSDNQIIVRQWGVSGDLPAVADYNGDGISDIAVFRQGGWFVLYGDGQYQIAGWGEPGDWPVPADYDGDGKADFAIWRLRTGNWWVLNSGHPSGDTAAQFSVTQWGLFGDYPVPADYNGDGRQEFAVWRPSSGTWYLRFGPEAWEAWQWGLPGDIPVVGSFLHEGNATLTVWRPSDGVWYHFDRRGTAAAAQWGLPGDGIPNRAG